jgi:hypothetical protein
MTEDGVALCQESSTELSDEEIEPAVLFLFRSDDGAEEVRIGDLCHFPCGESRADGQTQVVRICVANRKSVGVRFKRINVERWQFWVRHDQTTPNSTG